MEEKSRPSEEMEITEEYIRFVTASVRNKNLDLIREEKLRRNRIQLIPDYDGISDKKRIYQNHESIECEPVMVREFVLEIENTLLAEALRRLSEENLILIKRSFWDEIRDTVLAEELGISHAALRKRKSRIYRIIREFMEDYGNDN